MARPMTSKVVYHWYPGISFFNSSYFRNELRANDRSAKMFIAAKPYYYLYCSRIDTVSPFSYEQLA